MLPLRLTGVLSCDQDMEGREVMATPEITLLSTLRRVSLDILDRQSVPEKSRAGE